MLRPCVFGLIASLLISDSVGIISRIREMSARVPNVKTTGQVDGVSKQESPRRSHRKVYPFMTLVDLRGEPQRPSRSSRNDAELYGGLLSDADILSVMRATADEIDAQWALNMCGVRDARAVLAGIPNATVVEVGAFFGIDTRLYALMAGKVVAYEAGPSKVSYSNRKLSALQSYAREHSIALADVIVIGKAVSDRKGKATLHLPWGQSDLELVTEQSLALATTKDAVTGELSPVESGQDSIVP